MMDTVHVAVAVIADPQGRILLAKRHADAHQGGLWEFPGGKVEPGEALGDALVRECREELGIDIKGHRPLIRIGHDYGDRRVLLDVHRVGGYAGEPHGMEGQPLAWAAPTELGDYPMPAADRPIVNAICLPDLYAITPRVVGDRFVFLDQLRDTLERGVGLVQFRVAVSTDNRERLAEQALELCSAFGAGLLINEDIELARRVGAHGVHLKSTQLQELGERPSGLAWVAGSCHHADDLARLAELGGDFAVLSPVKRTASHPDASPLGWQAFQSLVAQATFPVYGLGGLDASDLPDAWQAGAQGIAAITGLWGGG